MVVTPLTLFPKGSFSYLPFGLIKIMIDGKTLSSVLAKMGKDSEVAKDAKVEVQMPDGKMYGIAEIGLMENLYLNTIKTHTIVLKLEQEPNPKSRSDRL
jgi:hypothetical protein